MANQFRVRKGLIVNGSGSTLLDVQGSQGQLFSVTDSLSGSLFSVKDISGIPVLEAFSDNRVNIGTFNQEAIRVSGSFAFLTGSLRGTASWAENARTASFVASSAIVGDLSRIATASFTASVNTSSFQITSASSNIFNIDNAGQISVGGIGTGLSSVRIYSGNANSITVNRSVVGYSELATFYDASGTNAYLNINAQAQYRIGGDTILARDSANTFAQRNSAISQSFRIYNTFTSLTDFERGKLEWSGSTFNIGTEQSGSGVARSLALQTSGSTRLFISGSNGFIGVNKNTPTVQVDISGSLMVSGSTSLSGSLTIDAGNISLIGGSRSITAPSVHALSISAGNLSLSHTNTGLTLQNSFWFGGGANVYDNVSVTQANTSPTTNGSILLKLSSTRYGFQLSQMTTAQRNAVSSPAQGLLVYVTSSVDEGIWYFNSGSYLAWTKVLNDSGSQIITGSLSVSSGITSSLFGTASWAQNAVNAASVATASWAINVVNGGGSITVADEGTSQGGATFLNFIGAGVTATVSSNTASITIPGGSGTAFPYTGSAEITGSLVVTGSVSATQGFSGSLFGTASWAQNAVTASYVLNAVSASFATTASFAQRSISASFSSTASFAQTASYGINIVISGSVSNADYIQFNTAASVTDAVGRLYYDNGEGTIKIGLAGGNVVANIGEDLYQYAYNATGAPLTKGQVVYISGSQGNRIAVKLASATAEQGSANTLGFVAEPIGTGGEGWIQTEGVLRKLNTTGLVGGQLLYLSSSAGEYTQTKPVAPLHEVRLGYAERIDASVGSIYIKIDNGYEIDELHNVLDTTTTSSYGDLFVKSGSLWVSSKQLTGSYGLTGSLRATTINASFLTASGNNYPTNPGTSSYFLQTDGAGNLSWNYVRSVLESVKNIGATTLVKGTPVYVTSSVGNTAEVLKADAGSASLMPATYILNETLTAGQQGLGIVLGFINNIDTSTFEESDQVYVAVGGGYTNVQPTGSALIQPLGTVVRVDNTNGSIMVSNTGVSNNIPNLNPGYVWMGNGDWLATPTPTSSLLVNTASFALTASSANSFRVRNNLYLSTPTYNTSSINVLTINTGSNEVEYSTINDLTFTKNIINVGLPGSRGTRYNVIKTAVQSITDAAENNTYTVRVAPGIYIEDTITVPSWVAIKGDSSISTVVSASNPSASIFVMSDQSMIIDMQLQGSVGPTASAVVYSSATTPQRNAIAYVENVRFGSNYTNAKVIGSGSSGNCILQCSNVKYGGYTDNTLQKSFDVGFHVTSGSGGGIGRMQLRNVTSTNGGVAGTDNNQIFALADAPGCTFIVNGCLLTRSTGAARGTGFKVYNGGQLRLTAVNFQRWINGIWAPQTGSAPSIDAIALNFENCTTDVLIEHTGSTGKVQGTDNFLKTQIALDAPLYEVGQDPRRITVGKKGADFTSISASVAYITDSSENNRYVIEVGPGQFTENTIDLTNKPYVSIVGSNIQTTQIFPSSSAQHIIKMGINNEISFLSLANAGPGYSAIYVDDVGDFAQAHKVSIYDSDIGITVAASTTDTQFYGEYIDINGSFSYGAYVSSSNGAGAFCNLENYYLFPSASSGVGNYATGPSASLNLYTTLFAGDTTANSTTIKLEDGAQLEANGLDIQDWDYALVVPNVGVAPLFRVVGSMIHDSVTYDFDIQNPNTIGRYQGVSDHTKINNLSPNFYWNFLDDTDGENDITRKLSVTFADGTHTDATTLIFKGSPMGVMQGGTISIQSGLTITTAAGFGYLQDAIDVDVYKRIDWNNTNITLAANTNNYIYINDNSVLSASGTAPDSVTNIILGRVVTNDTGIELIDQIPYDGEHTTNALSKFAREALGPVFAEGSIVSENVTPFKLDVTQGSYYFAENNFLPSGTSSINLNQYYISASAWARFTSSVVPNNVYASGSQLIPMSASWYTKHTVYLVGDGVDEEYFLVINGNQYSTLVEAEGANLPTIPTYFSDGVVPLAAVYVQSGSANVTQIEDIRPIIGFRAAGVNASAVHGNLLGLSADDHTQYLLVDGGRQMSGDLGLGGNDLYNFASLSGSSITASGANITNILATTINATSITGSLLGIAATASYVAQAVSASFASTASFVNPLTQNVQITGSLNISGSTTISTINAISITAPGNAGNFITFNSTGNSTNASIGQQNGLLNSNKSFSIQGDRLTFVNSVFSATYASMVASSTSGNISLIPSGSGILIVSGGLTVTGSTQITGSLNAPNITGSLFGTASWAQNAINALTASSADNFVIRQNITASNALFSGTVTAQTLIVQTITSSTDFVTGSTRFGSLLTNTHQFTGSVSITGSSPALNVQTDALINGVTVGRGAGNISSNTALGSSSLALNTTGTLNTAIGQLALSKATTAIENTALGASALRDVTAAYNTAVGSSALLTLSTGTNNVAIGINAGRLTNVGSGIFSNTNSVAIGSDARWNNDTETNQIVIGYQGRGLGSNTTVIGNSSTTTTWLGGNLLVGTLTGSGYRAEISGSAISGSLNVNNTLYVSGSRVGIDTNAPAEKLNVVGVYGEIRYGSTANSNKLDFYNTSKNLQLSIKGNDNLNTSGITFLTSRFDINTSLSILSSGNVGIRTTAPTALLHVSGSTASETLFHVQNNLGSSSLFVSSSGNVGIGTANPVSPLHVSASGFTLATFTSTTSQAPQINIVGTDRSATIGLSGRGIGISVAGLDIQRNNDSRIYFFNSNSTVTYGDVGQLSSTAFGLRSNTDLYLYASSSVNMYIASASGFVAVGRNYTAPSFSLDVSGSGRFTNGLQVTGSLDAPVITGSLFGTASWAQNVVTASYILQAVSASFASTASFVQLAQSASYILQAVSSSFATTASYAANGGVTAFNTRVGAITLLSTDISGLGAGIVSSSTFSSPSQGTLRATINGAQTDVDLGLQTGDSVQFSQVTASFTGSLTGALIGTASWAQNVVNASTASYVLQAVSASFATTSSFATTASYAANGGVTSFNTRVGAVSLTAGDISGLGAGIISGSTFSSPSQGTLRTVINGVQTDVDLGLQTADNVQFAQITGSNALFTGTLTAQTLVVQTVTSSTDFVTGSTRFGSLLTNTHQFTGSVTITGSLAVSGPATLNNLTGSLFGTSSWAQNVVTASYVTGSVFSSTNPALSASFATTASYAANGGVTAFNTRVGAVTLQASDISGLGAGIVSSSAFSSPSQGTLRAVINGAQTDVDLGLQTADNVQFAQVTASFTGSLTGALIGTASWANNSVTASYVTGSIFGPNNRALSASFAVTSSFATTAATATQVGANLTQGTGITSFTYNGSSAQTVAVAGASTLTTNELVKWNGTAFADSNIFDNGTNVFITASSVIVSGASSALIVTGSVRSTGGFTGSLFGTASYVTGALFTSANPALTASYAVTAAFALNAGGAASPITVADEGTAQGTATFLNFVGTGVSATVTSNTASITINTGGSAFPFTGSALVTGSFGVTGSLSVTSSGGYNQFGDSQFSGSVTSLFGYTGSLFGTASNAITASYALNAGAGGLQTKAGSVANTTFAGNPKKATVTFSTAFSNTSYAIVITGEDARSWTIESKVAGSFVINANSNTSLAGTTYWIATAYGET